MSGAAGGNGMAETKLAGYLVEFETVSSLKSACEKVRDAGYKNWDAHTPFPVHGLDDCMGLKPTALPWLSSIPSGRIRNRASTSEKTMPEPPSCSRSPTTEIAESSSARVGASCTLRFEISSCPS